MRLVDGEKERRKNENKFSVAQTNLMHPSKKKKRKNDLVVCFCVRLLSQNIKLSPLDPRAKKVKQERTRWSLREITES